MNMSRVNEPSRRAFLRSLALGVGAGALGPLVARAADTKALGPGDAFPDLGALQLEGTVPDVKGKVLHVDFWASWCVPCRASFPVLEELHRSYGPKGYVLLAVSMDEEREAMDKFLKKHPVTFAVVRDAAQKLAELVRPPGMPTSVFVGVDGRIHSIHPKFEGEKTRKKYVEIIEQLLAAAPAKA
jgi:thiol-disulfide isomerase/thioredoxin